MSKDALLSAIGNTDLTEEEKEAIEWLSLQSKADVIADIIKKVKTRGAGPKTKTNIEMIAVFKKEGKTQEWIARQMDISLSTVKRYWNR